MAATDPKLVRNLALITVDKGLDLTADAVTQLIDFKEMNSVAIQVLFDGAAAGNDGTWQLEVSLICEIDTLIPFPDSTKTMNAACAVGLGWTFCCFPWRYARLKYTAGATALGTADVYARARRT